MTSESGSALDITGFQNTRFKAITVFSLGLRSISCLLGFVIIINGYFAICVAGSEYGLATILLHKVIASESKIRVVVVALLNVVHVHEFAEFLGCFASFDPFTTLIFSCDHLFD